MLLVGVLVLAPLGGISLADEDKSAVVSEVEVVPTPDELISELARTYKGFPPEEISGEKSSYQALSQNDHLSTGSVWPKLIFALAITVGMIYFTLWFLRKFFFSTTQHSSNQVKVLAKTFLSPKSSVYLVRVPGKVLVVGESQNSVTVLGEVDPELAESISGAMPERQPQFTEGWRKSLSGLFGRELKQYQQEINTSEKSSQLHSTLARLKEKISRFSER